MQLCPCNAASFGGPSAGLNCRGMPPPPPVSTALSPLATTLADILAVALVFRSALRPHGLSCCVRQNFRGSYLLGQDVVAALRAELAAQGVDAEVPAVMNDTVATLVGEQAGGGGELGLGVWFDW